MVTEHDAITAIYLLSRRLEAAWLPPCPPEIDYYGHEPLPFGQFLAGMSVIGAPQGRRFLDVGCGIGTKLALAHLLGWDDLTGVEVRPQYVAIAKALCPEAKIEEADAFGWDGYGDFDVVYSYRPCVPNDLERHLEEWIVERMRPGALLFLPSREAPRGELLGSNVWRV